MVRQGLQRRHNLPHTRGAVAYSSRGGGRQAAHERRLCLVRPALC